MTGGRTGARVGRGKGMLLSRCLTQHRGTAIVGRGRKSIAHNADRVYEQRNVQEGGGYSVFSCRSHLTIDRASLLRRSTGAGGGLEGLLLSRCLT